MAVEFSILNQTHLTPPALAALNRALSGFHRDQENAWKNCCVPNIAEAWAEFAPACRRAGILAFVAKD